MAKPEQVYKYNGTLLRKTDKAVQIHLTEADEDIWLPLSQIFNVEDLFNSDSSLRAGEVRVEIPLWLAKEKGLA